MTTNSGLAAVGYQALANATGLDNTALGFKAGAAVTSGQANIAIGSQALLSATTGDANIAIGGFNSGSQFAALRQVSTGARNIGIGTGRDKR